MRSSGDAGYVGVMFEAWLKEVTETSSEFHFPLSTLAAEHLSLSNAVEEEAQREGTEGGQGGQGEGSGGEEGGGGQSGRYAWSTDAAANDQ